MNIVVIRLSIAFTISFRSVNIIMGSNPSPYPPSLPPPSPNNVPFDLHFANQQSTLAGLEHEVYQHGSIGEFITSTIEGVQSGFMRCIYRAKDRPSHETVTLLCEKQAACCVDGCCPKDQFWWVEGLERSTKYENNSLGWVA